MNDPDDDPSPTPRRQWTPAQRPVAWLATSGAVLVLVSAIASTVTNWRSLTIAGRLSLLVALHAVVCIAAERGRRRLPMVALVLAHLGAALAVPLGIGGTAAAQGSWRSCILIGGFVGVLASELQGRRWERRTIRALMIPAMVLSAAGAAAIFGVPVGVVLAIVSICALMIGSQRLSAALAAIAAMVPLMAVIARFQGPGTIVELGARGSILRWAAPLAGCLAAAVLVIPSFGADAGRLERRIRRIAASVAAVSGSAIGAWLLPLRLHLPERSAAFAPGVLLLMVELAAILRRRDARWQIGADAGELCSVAVLGGLAFTIGPRPLLVLCAAWLVGLLRPHRQITPWQLPALLAGLTLPLCALLAGHPLLAAWLVWLEVAGCGLRWPDQPTLEAAAVALAPLCWAQLVDLDLSRYSTALVLLVAGTVLLGVAGVLQPRSRSVDTAAISALMIGALSFPGSAAALLLTVSGVISLVWGWTLGRRRHRWIGATAIIVGLLWAVEHRRWDLVNGTDVVAVIVLLGAAWLELRLADDLRPIPSLALTSLCGSAYLLVTLADGPHADRLVLSIVCGAAAVAAGALTRRSAPVLGGALTILGSLLITQWAVLTDVPVWMWILASGAALLGLATTVESRSSRR